jgi:hypothetical protein
MATTPSSPDKEDTPSSFSRQPSLWSRVHLFTDVDPAAATTPMVAYCFMTGWMCVVHFNPLSTPMMTDL